ncbi:VOC family protein [Alteromonas sp. ASW11-36]|uniref:VOC family protein n=1 Tax=Alteromonas arenosi TaxID=3055817 RepID=A0ABT7T1E0_9ALTE|nr:VOC family protein [Alteromonas sp. ASW11-36]MDM7862270.1 VOC family protein [Alteromonas sp. ASW11-36]
MRLEHINMVVSDMDETLRFYSAAFPHWIIRMRGMANWYGVQRQWLHFGDDYNYLTFNDSGKSTPRDLHSNDLGIAHLGFEINNLAALRERMAVVGFTPSHTGAEHPHRRNTYYIDPNGVEVEFVEYLSDIPAQRNQSEEI